VSVQAHLRYLDRTEPSRLWVGSVTKAGRREGTGAHPVSQHRTTGRFVGVAAHIDGSGSNTRNSAEPPSHLSDRPLAHRRVRAGRYGLPGGADEGGPAGVDTGVVPEAGVDEGGPAGVDTGVVPEAGVDDGGPPGVEGLCPFVPLESFFPLDPCVPLESFVPLSGATTPAQYCWTGWPAAVAAFRRLAKATLWLLA
jgi:hypothetical protein